jgi:hypothetical protein
MGRMVAVRGWTRALDGSKQASKKSAWFSMHAQGPSALYGVCAALAMPNLLLPFAEKIAFADPTKLLFFLQKEGYQLAYGRLNNKGRSARPFGVLVCGSSLVRLFFPRMKSSSIAGRSTGSFDKE